MEAKLKKRRLSGLLRMAAPQKGKLIFSGLLAIIGEGFGIMPFFVIYKIIAEVGGKPPGGIEQRFIYMLIICAVAAIILKHTCMGISTSLSHISAYNILYDLRIAIAKKLRTLSLGYFNKKIPDRSRK